MNKILIYGGILIAIVIAVGLFLSSVNNISNSIGILVDSIATRDARLGAEGTRFPNGLSTDSTSPSNGQVRTTTLTVTGTSSVTGTSTVATTTSSGVDIIVFGTESLVTSTTTHWAIQPMASSTLVSGFCILTGSTTASTVGIAKSSTAFSTTTVLATTTVAANSQDSIDALATTTSNTLGSTLGRLAVDDRYFGPTDFLVVWQEGGAVGTFSPTGKCEATFLVP